MVYAHRRYRDYQRKAGEGVPGAQAQSRHSLFAACAGHGGPLNDVCTYTIQIYRRKAGDGVPPGPKRSPVAVFVPVLGEERGRCKLCTEQSESACIYDAKCGLCTRPLWLVRQTPPDTSRGRWRPEFRAIQHFSLAGRSSRSRRHNRSEIERIRSEIWCHVLSVRHPPVACKTFPPQSSRGRYNNSVRISIAFAAQSLVPVWLVRHTQVA